MEISSEDEKQPGPSHMINNSIIIPGESRTPDQSSGRSHCDYSMDSTA